MRWLESVPGHDKVEQARMEFSAEALAIAKEQRMNEEQAAELLEREIAREREVERGWDMACAHETHLSVEDPWGPVQVAAYCVGDKNHPGGHLYSAKTHMTPAEILREALPDWEPRPF